MALGFFSKGTIEELPYSRGKGFNRTGVITINSRGKYLLIREILPSDKSTVNC
jgi:hypothetical protein